MITTGSGAVKIEGTDNWRNIFDAQNETAEAVDQLTEDMAIIVSGNQTSHTGGAASGQYVLVRNSTITDITDGLYTASQAIPANTTIDKTYLTAVSGGALNALNNKLTNIGTVTTGTNISPLTVPSGSYTNVSSMTLGAGTYVITGGAGYSSSFSGNCYVRLVNGSIGIDGTLVKNKIESSSGDLSTSTVIALTATRTIRLSMYQDSGSNKTADGVSLQAVRIA